MYDLKQSVAAYLPRILEYRRHIHAHPELSGQEKETAAYIAASLRAIGLTPQEGIGGYGVTALIRGKEPGKCVGLRADFDALPLTEATGLPFSSQNPGAAHSCGHDVHTAVLLGAASVLNDLKDSFSGTVKLIFQPAEEDPMISGARKMIADGVLENPHVDGMFALHVRPSYTVGQIALRNGGMMASSDRFFLTVHGKSAHGSAPDTGVDAIVIASQIVSALQSVVSRNVSPLDNAVVTIGKIEGGNRYNIIADEVRMEGTCRNLNPAVRQQMPKRLETLARSIAEGMGGSCDFRYFMGYSPTVNDPARFETVCAAVRETLGEDALQLAPHSSMGGEDFSFFAEKVPSAYFWLGCRDPEIPPEEAVPVHNQAFAPSEDCIPVGVAMITASALRFLQKG